MIEFAKSGSQLNKHHTEWLKDPLGYNRGWGNTVSMGVYKPDLVAVVVYHDWNPEAGTIAMSAASTSKKWLNRNTLFKMHEYPFNQIGCQSVVLQVSEHNENMLRIAKSYGYEQHRIPRLRGKSEAEIINVLHDDVWRESRFTRKLLQTNQS